MNLFRRCVAAASFAGLALLSQTIPAQSFDAMSLQRIAAGQDLSLVGFVVLSDSFCAGSYTGLLPQPPAT
jgi:hypothetical protein